MLSAPHHPSRLKSRHTIRAPCDEVARLGAPVLPDASAAEGPRGMIMQGRRETFYGPPSNRASAAGEARHTNGRTSVREAS
jgi:hypothetical protein